MVLRFLFLGFGKVLASKSAAGRDGTEWTISAFPLGGYVKMSMSAKGGRRARASAGIQPPAGGANALQSSAGPLANLLLAVVLYWGLFSTGSEGTAAAHRGPGGSLTCHVRPG